MARKYVTLEEYEAADAGLRSEMAVVKFCKIDKSATPAEGSRVRTFIASDESVDRDGDVLYQKGIDWKAYTVNPVVLWAHNAKELPIGKAVAVRKMGTKTLIDVEFADAEANPKAEQVLLLVDKGFLNAGSLGFIPEEVSVVKSSDRVGFDVKSCEAVEFSIVPVPANSNALLQMAKSGIDGGLVTKELELVLKSYRLNKDGKVEAAPPSTKAFDIQVKDMYTVGCLARIMSDLSFVEDWQEYLEGDDDEVAAKLASALQALGQALITVTASSVAELIGEEDESVEKFLAQVQTKDAPAMIVKANAEATSIFSTLKSMTKLLTGAKAKEQPADALDPETASEEETKIAKAKALATRVRAKAKIAA